MPEPKRTDVPLRAKVFVALFMAAVGLPFLVFNRFSRQLSMDNHENRLLTTLPQVLQSSWRELLPNLDTFLIDNSPFRYQLVLLDASIDYRLFGTTQSSQVIAGRDGWLFYRAGPDAARPLADCQGLPDRNDSEETLRAAAASLQRLSDTLAARGCTLILDLAPAKERVYREYLPAGYPIVDETNRADRLAAYLAQHTTVPVNWRYAELRAAALARPGQLLYYRTDTHWNSAGALLSLDGILQTLGLPVLPFDQYPFSVREHHVGDLSNVAALYRVLPREEDLEVKGYGALFTPDPRSVCVIGDSFSQYYAQFLGVRFSAFWRRELADFTPETVDNNPCDILVLEVTERFIDDLLAGLAAF